MKKITLFIILGFSLNSFAQTAGNGLTDIDGNTYNTVIIGTQEWQKENLNVSKYTDGTVIPEVTDPTAWANLTTGAWCYYNNDPANGAVYGKLYNWYAVAGIHDTDPITPNKTLAPSGLHVPTITEWSTLTTFLGGQSVAGGKMKSTGTSLWSNPNTGATNSSGFTGLPGGYRWYNGVFSTIGNDASWWSSSEYDTTSALSLDVYYNLSGAGIPSGNNAFGVSVRCIVGDILSNPTFDTSNLQLYPNPVLSVLYIKTDYNLINQPYTIIDGLGRVVLYGKLNEVGTTINVEQLSKGIYYLKVSGKSASKFIKE
jgi:uncharacterized protein (TIGR02145 family)